jgi:hypothetical protein
MAQAVVAGVQAYRSERWVGVLLLADFLVVSFRRESSTELRTRSCVSHVCARLDNYVSATIVT